MTKPRTALAALSANSAIARSFARADRGTGPRMEVLPTTTDGDDTTTVLVYGFIGDDYWGESVLASAFARDMAGIGTDRIDVHVNSPGGTVYDGISIANTIRQHKAHVTVYVDGIAASAASFIAVAGDELVMGRNTELMIHDALTIVWGNAGDLREIADHLDTVSDNIATFYAEKSGTPADGWREAMRAETWYTAEEAVAAGLADRVDDSKQRSDDEAAKNRFDLSVFAHAGRDHAPAPRIPDAPAAHAAHKPPAEPAEPHHHNPKEPDMSDTLLNGLRERLGIKADAELTEAQALAALDEALTERAESTNHTPPAGVIQMDADQHRQLLADAQMGREARNEQLAAGRRATVQAAIDDGRIPPARADHWVAQLQADPGADSVLAKLQPGTIPVAALGYTGGVDEASDDDDRLFAKISTATGGKTPQEG